MERLWTYRYDGAMLRYVQSWIDQLRWQRLVPFELLKPQRMAVTKTEFIVLQKAA